ncbi:glycosyltransferase, partial [Mycobacterium tuberculosis]
FVEECPIVSATEASIYDVLKELLSDENRRRELAKASRDFVVKWHSADACAERFEMVYDRVMQGLPPSNIPFGQVLH